VVEVVEVPKPELSTVVSLDPVAAETREVIIEPNPPQAMAYSVTAQNNVDSLKLGPKVTETLSEGGYTIEELAVATPQKLSSLQGIGIKRANTIIAKAKAFLES
jgi:hypothetical protein